MAFDFRSSVLDGVENRKVSDDRAYDDDGQSETATVTGNANGSRDDDGDGGDGDLNEPVLVML